ncbi:hypothetical protein [Proteiniclasticum sp. QWL-01]|uniref:hypothetical protein n=1 Tax=Proteiniclasticum sp. QWL-01 TaxID=3036945 RepID=UPI002411325D|nr:hypothetical protein [Proteiniclasticum sp. QWL-01]WFF73682.1 hypothetical protein P6M73_04340 [Proteiniclasticum sp. QWL-01]
MLLFSAMLEINDTLTQDAFIQLVIEWNQGSPHQDNIIANLSWNGERNIRFGEDDLWLGIEEYRNQNIIAVRFEKKEASGIIWDTDYIMNFNSMKMAIRLDRSYTEDFYTLDLDFSTPHFITLLIQRGYHKDDHGLPVLRTPMEIHEENLELLADVINGETSYRLPVVYVSKTDFNENPVDVYKLAGRLKGVAHVLVQKNRSDNFKLMNLCDRKNEYHGAIGIYYPNPVIRHGKYFYRNSFGIDDILSERVIRAVFQYGNNQTVDVLYTWQGVGNAILRDKYDSQIQGRIAAERAKRQAEEDAELLKSTFSEEVKAFRQKALDDADKILESFEEDLRRRSKQVEDLTRANERLVTENQGLRAKLDFTDSTPLLSSGNEFDFYPGEIKDILLSILEEALPAIHPKSRRADIIKDLIKNNDYKKITKKRQEEVKQLLKNYEGMTPRVRQELVDMGFEILDDGKHFKLKYYGDGRYQTSFAKTPSDFRSGKNNAQTLIKIAF